VFSLQYRLNFKYYLDKFWLQRVNIVGTEVSYVTGF
jgi:hypothetical protein